MFLAWARYFRMSDHIYYIEWDYATTTAGDYTLMMKISPEMFKLWNQTDPKTEPVGLAFKSYLKKSI